MSVQKVPLITTLLRASRNQDEDLIKYVLQHILTNGISEEDLNAVDCSGRTAISYMCSTNVTNFLEVLLETPGIDINKPDVELNTPLHHAAECGQLGALRLLLSQSKLNIDAKNIFGFTPLMKAAIQGHNRCAKLLLFAGASPTETDNKRMLRAEQWARFCGRHACAEVIEKCSRVRLDKETPFKWSHETFAVSKEKPVKSRARANSTIQTSTKVNMLNIKNNSEGIRSKISKVLNFVSRDKSSSNQSQTSAASKQNSKSSTQNGRKNAELGNAFNPATPSSKSNGRPLDAKFINAMGSKGAERPMDVPKLEVTSPHNQDLIKKYETRYSPNLDGTKPPALPPRRNSKIIL